uniref:Reverse transcriptase N-terminal domain-containing protein n=1 Tax=Avrainvillea sp. HV04061 TaxID=2364086 RepID=A0A3B8CL99_9CHLO|nr:hypothetical protein [Avrainvillea sp. HV04061]
MNHIISWHNINWKMINYYVTKIQIEISKSSKDGNLIKVRNFQKLLLTSKYYLIKCIEESIKQTDENKEKLFLKFLYKYNWNLKFKYYKNINLESNLSLDNQIFKTLIKNILEPEWDGIIGFSVKKITYNLCEILNSEKYLYLFETKIIGILKLEFIEFSLSEFPAKDLLLKLLKLKLIDSSNDLKSLLFNICLFKIKSSIILKNATIIYYKTNLLIISKKKKYIFYTKNIIDIHLKKYGLKLVSYKLIDIKDQNFQFIGFQLKKKYIYMLIEPSVNAKKQMIFHLSKIWKFYYGRPCYEVINAINNYIIRWKNYYKFCNINYSNQLDKILFYQALHFAKRTHPKKGTGWIIKKYFKKSLNNKWIFFDTDPKYGIIMLNIFENEKLN